MISVVKFASISSILFLAATAIAQTPSYSYSSPYSPTSAPAAPMAASRSGTKMVSGELGFFSSGIGTVSDGTNSGTSLLSGFYGIGGDFDYFTENDISFGGIFRYYNTQDTVSGTDTTNTLTSLGAVGRAYFNTRNLSFVGTTGVGFADATVKTPARNIDSGMSFGLYLGLTFLYRLNRTTQVGFENLRIMGLGDKLNGWVLSDYMAKICFTL